MRPPTRRFHIPSALRSSPFRIGADAARELVGEGALVIDARRHDDDDDDDDARRVQGALRISPHMIPSRVADFRRDVAIVVGCT